MRRFAFLALLLGTSALADRPTLSGPEELHASADGHFLVHFTRQGVDAVTIGDTAPANGVPDEVDDLESGMHLAWEAFVTTDGWPAPPADEGRGGDARLDVYVRDIDAFGYTYFEPVPSGSSSYIEIDPANSTLGRTLARTIAGHEFHHALQAAVTVQLAPWIYEATATWVQYGLFTDADIQLVRDLSWSIRLQSAARALDDTGGRFEYASMTWVQFLVDRAHAPRTQVLELWKAMAREGDWEAGHRAFLSPETLEDVVTDFGVWNLFACRRADGHHYTDTLPCTLDVEVPTTKAQAPASGQTMTVGRFGAAYVEFEHDCQSNTLDLELSSSEPFSARVVHVRAAGESPSEPLVVVDRRVAQSIVGWNDDVRTVLVLTNLGTTPATFSWAAKTSGTYQASPAPSAARSVSVTPVEPQSLSPGETLQLSATGRFGSCATGANVAAQLPWRSSEPGVVSVEGGLVRALSPGTAEVFVDTGALTSNRVTITVGPRGCGCGLSSTSPWVVLGALVLLRRVRRTQSV